MKRLLLLFFTAVIVASCSPENCTDGIQNQNETGIDCGGVCTPCPSCNDGILNQGEEKTDCGGPCGVCPIIYPDYGQWGVNLLNHDTMHYRCGSNNILSIRAEIPKYSSLKVVLTNTSSSPLILHIWYFDGMSTNNVAISSYSNTTYKQELQTLTDDEPMEMAFWFSINPGSVTIDIYENWATTPTRTKYVTWGN